MRVTRLELRDFRNYEAAELELPRGPGGRRGPNGAGKTNLLEARLLRLHRGARRGPRTSASWFAAAPAVARVVVDTRDDDGRATHRGRLRARRGEAPARRRQRCHSLSDYRRPAARERVHARAPRAREGRAGGPPRPPRPGRRRALARSRRARAAYSRALAQRNALLAASGPARRARRRSTRGTPSWRARASP